MLKAYSTLDFAVHLFKVHVMMKLTYHTLPYDDDNVDDIQETFSGNTESGQDGDTRQKKQWDDDCPWSEWYSAEDPVKGKELPFLLSSVIAIIFEINTLSILNTEHSWLFSPNFYSLTYFLECVQSICICAHEPMSIFLWLSLSSL